MLFFHCFFFFFKQKTAYEMRISDWSSDVCSSDLPRPKTESPPATIPLLTLDYGPSRKSGEHEAVARPSPKHVAHFTVSGGSWGIDASFISSTMMKPYANRSGSRCTHRALSSKSIHRGPNF